MLLEAGEGGGFVLEDGDGVDEAGDHEDFEHVAAEVEELEFATVAVEGGVSADQCGDTGAINLSDAGEIHDELFGAGVELAAQFMGESVVGIADGDAASHLENHHRAGLADVDRENTGRSLGLFHRAHYTMYGRQAETDTR